MRYMTKAWAPAIVSVLCAIIFSASIDRVPDPPAVKPQHVAACASSFHPPAHCTPVQPLYATLSAAAASVKPAFVSEASSAETPNAPHLLLRQAADASPPAAC
jgi:hypothetical protein